MRELSSFSGCFQTKDMRASAVLCEIDEVGMAVNLSTEAAW